MFDCTINADNYHVILESTKKADSHGNSFV